MTVVDDDSDLLPDHLLPKGQAQPLKRTPKQRAAAARVEQARREAADLAETQDRDKARAQQLAQIVNLSIAGYSHADIAAAIGGTEASVEKMLLNETGRYIRTQPALRTYVRNWISQHYHDLLDAVWDEATDKNHSEKLENQAQALRILKEMTALHGAAMPTQAEVKVETAPEDVDALVAKIAQAAGVGYDTAIFDVVPGSVVRESGQESARALEVSGNAVEQSDGHDDL